MASAWLRIIRPRQWTKNLLVFAGWIFTHGSSNPKLAGPVLLAFVAMCMASSASYAVNDALDAERDRLHPRKKNRPVACGAISKLSAMTAGLLGAIGALVVASLVNASTAGVVAAYLLLQIVYNAGIKRVPVLDVFGIATGFLLRAAAGATAISVLMSGWLLFCTGALALMIGFGKRRQELLAVENAPDTTRESLRGYSKEPLDALVIVSASVASLCFGLYSIDSPTAHRYPGIILTAVFVFYGICRYVFRVFRDNEGGEPETLLYRDPHIWVSIVLFVVFAMLSVSGLELPVVAPNGG